MGKLKAASRKKNNYWGKQKIRTASNLTRKLERHCLNHPGDIVAERALKNLPKRLK